jgi:SAM-dependent methyltransferase
MSLLSPIRRRLNAPVEQSAEPPAAAGPAPAATGSAVTGPVMQTAAPDVVPLTDAARAIAAPPPTSPPLAQDAPAGAPPPRTPENPGRTTRRASRRQSAPAVQCQPGGATPRTPRRPGVRTGRAPLARRRQSAPAVKDQNGSPPGRRAARRGLLRSVRLFRLFLVEQTDPDRFYTGLAEDAVCQVEEYADLAGATVVDVGGGAGYFTEAFRAKGARCYLFEPDQGEMASRGEGQCGAVVADGYWLPVRDGGADVCFSSNVLEHVRDPMGLAGEMIRATRPGGLIYLSFTNWYSPWGGHEMSPWHYLGHRFAERRYVKRHGRLPKNRYGTSLFPLHIGPVLRAMRARVDIDIVDARPRYYPHWCRFLLWVPGLREIVTWNLLLILRRKG